MFDIRLSGLGWFLMWVLVYHAVAFGINWFLGYFYDSDKAYFLLKHVEWTFTFKDWMWSMLTHPFRTRNRRLFKEIFDFDCMDKNIDFFDRNGLVSHKLENLGSRVARTHETLRKNPTMQLKSAYKLARKMTSANLRSNYTDYI